MTDSGARDARVADVRRMRDVLAEVVAIGVGNGLTTLGVLMPGHRFEPEPMRCQPSVPHATDSTEAVEADSVALCFDVEGFFDARLGLFLADGAKGAFADILLGPARGGVADPELEHSALAEVGNILASAFANAVGRLLGEVVMVGPPETHGAMASAGLAAREQLGWLVRGMVTLDGGPQRFQIGLWINEDSARRVVAHLSS